MVHDQVEKRWITAAETLQMLTASGKNPADVESMIAAYLRNGHLHARAKKIWRSDERFTTAAWKSCPPDAVGGEIPTGYWRREKAIDEDRAQWRFVANRFLATTRLKPRRRIMMRGVEFLAEDLKRLQPETFGAQSVKRKRGRPPGISNRDSAWRLVLEALLQRMDGPADVGDLNSFTEQALFRLDAEKEGKRFGPTGEDQIKEVAQILYGQLNRLQRLKLP